MPLTPFQRRKLARMFAVFDLDHDGAIRRSDYTRRVEAVARLRGWTQRSPEYERNLKFALMEWEALCESADIDQDGQVARDEFLLHYQPQVGIPGREIICMEALLRWRPLGRDLISPSEFIPVAEAT